MKSAGIPSPADHAPRLPARYRGPDRRAVRVQGVVPPNRTLLCGLLLAGVIAAAAGWFVPAADLAAGLGDTLVRVDVVAGALARDLGVAVAIAVFLTLGLVAGLTEGAERALVARLAPVRTGRGFGVYHALTGLAALPAGFAFGALYQERGPQQALLASALGVAAAVVAWLAITAIPNEGAIG